MKIMITNKTWTDDFNKDDKAYRVDCDARWGKAYKKITMPKAQELYDWCMGAEEGTVLDTEKVRDFKYKDRYIMTLLGHLVNKGYLAKVSEGVYNFYEAGR